MPYKDKYNRWKLGLCCDCKRPAVKGNTYCQLHLDIKKARTDLQRKKRKENGLCTECGQKLELTDRVGFTRCVSCADINVIQQRRRREFK